MFGKKELVEKIEYSEKVIKELREENILLRERSGQKDKDYQILKERLQSDYELKEKKAVAALEDKLAKEVLEIKKEHDKNLMKFKEAELEKQQRNFQKLTDENYSKFREELSKIHSEGNVMTKNIQEMNKEMIHTVGLVAANTRQQLTGLEYKKE